VRHNVLIIAAFSRLAKSISYSEHIRWLAGAVGIETPPPKRLLPMLIERLDSN